MPSQEKNQAVILLQKKKLQQLLKKWQSPESTKPILIMLAGCNGAGKSSFYTYLAANTKTPPVFLNADLLAIALNGIPAPDTIAQRIADMLREHMLGHSTTFVTETVFPTKWAPKSTT